MIKELLQFQQKLENQDLQVNPGQNETYPISAGETDCGRQGDIYFGHVLEIPENYVLTEQPFKQLTPNSESTKGAKHCLKHLNDLEMYLPENWSHQNYEGLMGPIIKFNCENQLLHGEHGDVLFEIKAGDCIEFRYQRNYDVELERERRARD